jgi:uncharacterized protein YlbG (UPF0298 family)
MNQQTLSSQMKGVPQVRHGHAKELEKEFSEAKIKFARPQITS